MDFNEQNIRETIKKGLITSFWIGFIFGAVISMIVAYISGIIKF